LKAVNSIVSFGVFKGGYIERYKRERSEAVNIIAKEFNDCFAIQQSNVEAFVAEIEQQL
jgi:hypothetical protein